MAADNIVTVTTSEAVGSWQRRPAGHRQRVSARLGRDGQPPRGENTEPRCVSVREVIQSWTTGEATCARRTCGPCSTTPSGILALRTPARW